MTFEMTIGVLSRRTGCPVETIRFYEKAGLLPPPRRRGSYRVYGNDDLSRLVFVRRARELGFSIEEVRALLHLAVSIEGSCGDVQALAMRHLAEVRTRLSDLRRMERALEAAIAACGRTSETDCPLIASLTAGAGAGEVQACGPLPAHP